MSLSDWIYNADELNEGKVLFKANVKEAIKKLKEKGLKQTELKNKAFDTYSLGVRAGVIIMVNLMKEEFGKELCSEVEE